MGRKAKEGAREARETSGLSKHRRIRHTRQSGNRWEEATAPDHRPKKGPKKRSRKNRHADGGGQTRRRGTGRACEGSAHRAPASTEWTADEAGAEQPNQRGTGEKKEEERGPEGGECQQPAIPGQRQEHQHANRAESEGKAVKTTLTGQQKAAEGSARRAPRVRKTDKTTADAE